MTKKLIWSPIFELIDLEAPKFDWSTYFLLFKTTPNNKSCTKSNAKFVIGLYPKNNFE